MSFWRSLLVIVLALGTQIALGRVWPAGHGYANMLLVPVALSVISGTPRTAMTVGCLSGLLYDTWLRVGTFGASGFKWTLLAWVLGSFASRVDLAHGGGRFLIGASLVLGDRLLDPVLLPLLDQRSTGPGFWELLIQATLTGLLTALVGRMVDSSGSESAGTMRRLT